MLGFEAAHEAAGGHGHGGSVGPLWLRVSVFALGVIVGWLLSRFVNMLLGGLFRGFNWVFDVAIKGYGAVVGVFLRLCLIVLVVYGGLIGLTYWTLMTVPQGFIPDQDKGYLVVNVQLPDGASLDRSEAVVRKLSEEARATEGVAHTIDLPGYSTILSTNISNVGGMFVILEPFEEWVEDWILDFVRTYLALHENQHYQGYHKGYLVEDPVAEVRFPKHAAAATCEWNGRSYYFISQETCQEFQRGHGIAG